MGGTLGSVEGLAPEELGEQLEPMKGPTGRAWGGAFALWTGQIKLIPICPPPAVSVSDELTWIIDLLEKEDMSSQEIFQDSSASGKRSTLATPCPSRPLPCACPLPGWGSPFPALSSTVSRAGKLVHEGIPGGDEIHKPFLPGRLQLHFRCLVSRQL